MSLTVEGNSEVSEKTMIEDELSNLHRAIKNLEDLVHGDLTDNLNTVLQPKAQEDEADEGFVYGGSPVRKEVKVAESRVKDLYDELRDIINRLDLSGEM